MRKRDYMSHGVQFYLIQYSFRLYTKNVNLCLSVSLCFKFKAQTCFIFYYCRQHVFPHCSLLSSTFVLDASFVFGNVWLCLCIVFINR